MNRMTSFTDMKSGGDGAVQQQNAVGEEKSKTPAPSQERRVSVQAFPVTAFHGSISGLGVSGVVNLRTCALCGRQSEYELCICPCEQVFYCDVECQTAHWPLHKSSCQHGRKSAVPDTQCASCGTVSAGNMWCPCGTVMYCSVKCQRTDWDEKHYLQCRATHTTGAESCARGGCGVFNFKTASSDSNLSMIMNELKGGVVAPPKKKKDKKKKRGERR